jgi:hypothetical protein
MQGIAVADGTLLAWGKAVWVNADQSMAFVPVFWTSNDGLAWTGAPSPTREWAYPKVTRGPEGFIVANEGGSVLLSADGRSWELTTANAFGGAIWVSGSGANTADADLPPAG